MISENDILKVSANFLSAITDVWNIAFLIMWGGITLFALNTLVKYSLTLPLLFIFLAVCRRSSLLRTQIISV